MASDEQLRIALDAISSRNERFRSAVAATADKVRGLLAGTGDVADDQSVALGHFAQGRVNSERFGSFSPKARRIDAAAEVPIRAAQEILKAVLEEGDALFVLHMEPGQRLSCQVNHAGCRKSTANR